MSNDFYKIEIGEGDDDSFYLYKNDNKITKALWIYHLLLFIADAEGVNLTGAKSESNMLAILQTNGVDVDAGTW